jgi:chorismate mutase
MKELPKRFPEYSIMHKTILKQIKELEEESILKKNQTQTQNKIKMYKSELEKIEKMFPENFFKNETDYS